MRQVLLLKMIVILAISPMLAQDGLTARVNNYGYLAKDYPDSRKFIQGGEIGLYKTLNSFLDLYVPIRAASLDAKGMLGIDPQVQASWHNKTFLTPFASLGLNFESFDSKFGFGIPLGIGLHVGLNDYVALTAQSQYSLINNNRLIHDQLMHSFGVTIRWGEDWEKRKMKGAMLSDRDGDGIPDHMDECPDIPGVAEKRGCPEFKVSSEIKSLLDETMRNVNFETGSAKLLESSFTALNNVVRIMNANPGLHVKIEGHTDNTGTDAINNQLSIDRAKACYDYLVSQGISQGRLSYKGYGSSRPIASNDTPEGRAQNRRVEFTGF